jgi:FkbM family methyltransferase
MKPWTRRLRSALPAPLFDALVQVRHEADRAAGAIVGALGHTLPLRARVLAKARLASTGRLDYGGGHVELVMESEAELARLNSCAKEPETVAWIEEWVRAGDVVFDVGANVGVYSFVVDRATGGGCRVYAFEPSFSTFAQLSRNVALNRMEGRVIPIPLALSDGNGLVTFHYSSLAAGTALHAIGAAVGNKGLPFVPAFVQPVLTRRMDDFIAELPGAAPNHVKLDVDGAELKVLQGAGNALALPTLRTLLIEVEPALPEFPQIVALLESKGLRLRARYPHGRGEDSTANCLFTRTPSA